LKRELPILKEKGGKCQPNEVRLEEKESNMRGRREKTTNSPTEAMSQKRNEEKT